MIGAGRFPPRRSPLAASRSTTLRASSRVRTNGIGITSILVQPHDGALFNARHFQFETIAERFADITRCTTEPDHRVFLHAARTGLPPIRLRYSLDLKSDMRTITFFSRCRMPRRWCNALYQTLDVKFHRVGIAANALVDLLFTSSGMFG